MPKQLVQVNKHQARDVATKFGSAKVLYHRTSKSIVPVKSRKVPSHTKLYATIADAVVALGKHTTARLHHVKIRTTTATHTAPAATTSLSGAAPTTGTSTGNGSTPSPAITLPSVTIGTSTGSTVTPVAVPAPPKGPSGPTGATGSSTGATGTSGVSGTSTGSSAGTSLSTPSGYSAGNLAFDSNFAGSALSSSDWNSYITSAAANGWPWNANGSGGSSAASPNPDLDAEYDLPSQAIVNNGLDLQARNQSTQGMLGSSSFTYPWRSGTVSTYGKFQFDGGYLQIRAKMPAGDGMWPGLWLLPGSGNGSGDNYEIDLFEGGYTGNGVSPHDNFAWHLHTPSGTFGSTSNVGTDLTASYHVYGLRWIPGQEIDWYLDGTKVGSVTSAQGPIPNEPMELILDLQVANSATSGWHTVPDGSTPSTNDMLVSDVQVYR